MVKVKMLINSGCVAVQKIMLTSNKFSVTFFWLQDNLKLQE